MSSQLQVSGEAKIRDIQGPVVANSGVITALDGAASQYVRGDGTLADFPTSSGGGSSVSYYLNSSVSQGTIGGVAYRELSKEPIIGAGTDIAISSNGYVASYLTDANDPDVILIPGGNFNCEFYFSVNNNTGNPFFYAELYKYDGTTFTLLGSSVGVPEYINQGTVINPYYFAIPVATATLALTDRLAIRIYVNVGGRTITLHTENGHLCQVVTTLSKGMVSLNNLTDQSQFITTGTSGTNFAIVSSGDTHTFNLPVASATNTGKLSSTDWSTFNNKLSTAAAAATYVPYTGANASVDLGAFSLTADTLNSVGIFSIGSGTQSGYIGIKQGTTFLGNITGYNSINANGTKFILISDIGSSNYKSASFQLSSLTNNTERTYTLPDVSGTLALLEGTQTFSGAKTFSTGIKAESGIFLKELSSSGRLSGYVGISATATGGMQQIQFLYPVSGSSVFSLPTTGAYNYEFPIVSGTVALTSDISYPVTSVFGRTGAVVAASGDYNTSQVTELTNLYFTDARSRAALSFTAGSGAYNSTTGVITIPTNTNQLTNGASFITLASLSGGTGITYNNTTGVITNSAPDQTVSLTAGAGISISGTYPSFTIASTITQYTDALARAAISLTTTGTSGAATYNSTTGVFNIPNYAPDLSGYVPTSRTITINGTSFDLSANRTYSVGTVTSVGLSSATSGVTIGSTPITTSGTITLAIATASGSQNGLLSSTDWTTFNGKQSAITLTTTGSSGAATLVGSTLNIPNYGTALSGYLPLTGGTLTGALNISNDRAAAPIPFKVDNNLGYGIYLSADNALNFNYSRNETSTGYINYRGYNDGATQFRNLVIADGKNATIAEFTASSKLTTLYGSLLIGYTVDAGFKLDVSGTARVSNFLEIKNNASNISYLTFQRNSNTQAFSLIEGNGENTTGWLKFYTSDTLRLTIAGNGAATFSSSVTSPVVKLSDSTLSGAGNFEFTSEAFFGARFQSNAYKFMAGNNSTEYMRITSGGRVGIGQTAPGTALSVAGQSEAWQLALTTANGTAGAVIGSPSANVLAFGDWSGAERMRITSGGYLKASNNGSYLGSTGAYHELRQSAQSTASVVISASNASFDNNVLAVGSTRAASNAFNLIAAYANDFNDLKFVVRGDGNVGIGTSSPITLTEINAGSIGSGGSAKFALAIRSGTTTYLDIYQGYNSTIAGQSMFGTTLVSSDALAFATSSTERMRITIGGNVLIATTTDNGQGKLQVNGAITANNISYTGELVTTSTTFNTTYYHIISGAVGSGQTYTLPSPSSNNLQYVVINKSNFSQTISAGSGFTIYNMAGSDVGSITLASKARCFIIADGSGFYQIF
jgi:hypothetical protein